MLWKPQEGASDSAWEDLGGFRGVALSCVFKPSGEGKEGSSRDREQLVHSGCRISL